VLDVAQTTSSASKAVKGEANSPPQLAVDFGLVFVPYSSPGTHDLTRECLSSRTLTFRYGVDNESWVIACDCLIEQQVESRPRRGRMTRLHLCHDGDPSQGQTRTGVVEWEKVTSNQPVLMRS
jgi:hypothetical protein